MSEKAQIYIELKDNYSAALLKAKEIQSKFTNDVVGLQKRLNEFNQMRYEVKLELDKVNKEFKEAQKNAEGFDEALQSARLEEYEKRIQGLKDDQELFNKAARNTKNELNAVAGVFSKLNNRPGNNNQDQTAGFTDIAKTVASSELLKQYMGGVTSMLNAQITSKYGASTGATIQNVGNGAISGLTSGAALGTAIAPGIGTAIGAGVGTIVGAISGGLEDAAQKQTEMDDRFRSVVDDVFNEVQQIRAEMLSSGVELAQIREANLSSFATLMKDEAAQEPIYRDFDTALAGIKPMLDGNELIGRGVDSKEYAQKFLDEINAFGRETPFGYDQLTELSKTLLSYGYESKEILPMLTQIGDAGTSLRLGAEGMNAVATYIGRMKLTDKVTMEYLQPLQDRGLEVIDYIRESLAPDMEGITNKDVQEMISKGELSGEAVAQVILDYMGEEYKGAMEDYQNSYEGMLSTLDDWKNEMDAAMGGGFADARKASMKETIDFYEQNASDLTEMYRKIGEYEAEQVNAQETAFKNSMQSALDEFRANGDLSSAKISQLEQRAQAAAEIEFKNSSAYQTALEGQMNLIEFIQGEAAIKDGWDKYGREMANLFSQGFEAGIEKADLFGFTKDGSNVGKTKPVNVPYADPSRPETIPEPTPTPGRAIGIPYVPEDDYAVRLHRGERVLTAAQAREMDGGHTTRTAGVTVTGNTFNVRKESDIDAIALALYTRLREAEQTYVD